MVEIRQSLSSMTDWTKFRHGLSDGGALRTQVVSDVRTYGLKEPVTGLRRHPDEIEIVEKNLHESVRSHELNSRKRALILQLWLEIVARDWRDRKDLRILCAEGLTPLAMILRGRYPFFYGGEYLPSAADKKRYFPIPHLDLHAIDLPDASFDMFVSGDVFEHLPFLDQALGEIHRVLKPGGVLVSSFPFAINRPHTLVRARMSGSGKVTHLLAPEYHGNPVDPRGRSLVFQLPAWDILEKLQEIGFEDAYFSMLVSSGYGIASENVPGPLVLTAAKPSRVRSAVRRPPDLMCRMHLPEKLCALVALPRSGATPITSALSAHSKVEAVFEPWSATEDFEGLEPSIEAISKIASLKDLSGKILLVKETAARHAHILKIMHLLRDAPDVVEKHVLVALRKPSQTFLSEVTRRGESWQEKVTANTETFKNWIKSRRSSLRMILQFALHYNGHIISLGSFAEHPDAILAGLAWRIGFTVEKAQLAFENHLDSKIVRGHRNVLHSPASIDVAKVNFRDPDARAIQASLADPEDKAWLEAFDAIYEAGVAAGGVMSASALPAALREVLLKDE